MNVRLYNPKLLRFSQRYNFVQDSYNSWNYNRMVLLFILKGKLLFLLKTGGFFKLLTMSKTKIEYQLVFFLYAYLTQMDLSLDRSSSTSLHELAAYYKIQIAPGRAANYLLRKFDLDVNRTQDVYYVAPVALSLKIRSWLELHFKRECILSKTELYYCCQKLLILDQYLNSSREVHKLEIEKLRVELSKFTFGVLQSKLFKKDRIKAQRVEHFLQNENLDVIRIEEFNMGLDL